MDLVFPIAAFLLTLAATTRSLGLGLGIAVAVGYFNGVIRANFLGVFTTFMFDAGLFGFYLGACISWSDRLSGLLAIPRAGWVIFLIVWPTVLALIPVNDLLVQLVALRGTVWFLPVLLIASRLTSADLAVYTRVVAVMNLFALAGGIYVYQNGVESLYPMNAVTQIIYMSKDVGGHEYHRIPSIFLSAHAYGGTMLYSFPLLVDRLMGPGVRWTERVLAGIGLAAAGAGILLCAARMPVVMFAVVVLLTWVGTRFNSRVGLCALALLVAGVATALTDDRLQRAGTLEDTDAVSDRVKGSANDGFFEFLAAYPGGAGMGSSVGTSIPFFLADRAPVPIGLENEFSRILIDQGWVGLAGWLGFLVWLFWFPPPARPMARWGIGVAAMYGLCMPTWALGFMGTGALSAIPQSVMLLAMMGVLLRVRNANSSAMASQTGRGS